MSAAATASISPSSRACSASIASAVSNIRKAARGPINRGSRWVPPAPGLMPSVTSGIENRAAGVAMRKWQAAASSRALPNTRPAKAMATGLGQSSTAWKAS